ncbi:MAG: 6-phosphogluconolactonase [Pseudomonadota bacterium]
MTQSIFNWHQFKNAEQVAEIIYQQIELLSGQAIEKNGQFKLVLAGGTTPGVIYKKLSKLKTDWRKWQIFFGDERCLETDNSERNSKMVALNWLDCVPIPVQNIHIIQAHLGAKKAAILYQQTIESVLPFDLVLNGMGEDGHTASLFPQQQHDQQQSVHAIYHSPKPPSDRVSLSTNTLSTTHRSFIIITGMSKYQAVNDWHNGKQLPVNQLTSLRNKAGGVDVYIDQGAYTGTRLTETSVTRRCV